LEDILSQDAEKMPRWFSGRLNHLLGRIPRGDVTVVGARPGGGKTTFLLAQARHMVLHQNQKIAYCSTEISGGTLWTKLAALDCGLDVPLVIQNRWSELPPGARERVLASARTFRDACGGKWVFTPQERTRVADLKYWIARVETSGGSALFVDHLHEIDWGPGDNLTHAMSRALHELKDHAKQSGVRLFLAAQLKRGMHDALEDYRIPPQSAIKQCGTSEEIAHTIVMLHRALNPRASDGEIALVMRGQGDMSAVVEKGTMVAHVAKSRLVGAARDAQVKLYIGNDEIFDSPEAREASYGSNPYRSV
jgi:replicative DNA helicase